MTLGDKISDTEVTEPVTPPEDTERVTLTEGTEPALMGFPECVYIFLKLTELVLLTISMTN